MSNLKETNVFGEILRFEIHMKRKGRAAAAKCMLARTTSASLDRTCWHSSRFVDLEVQSEQTSMTSSESCRVIALVEEIQSGSNQVSFSARLTHGCHKLGP